MKRYIEVTGQGILLEPIVEYRAELSVAVRAVKAETAMAEVAELRDQCVRRLRAAGLRENDLREGGAEVWRPWFWKKKPGEEASHTILISNPDVQRLYRALADLEPLFENQRYSIAVSMQRPRFEAPTGAKDTARASAIRDARSKAELLAREAGVSLGAVAQIQEYDELASRSGARGDEEWRGPYVAAAAVAAGGEPPPFEELEAAQRKVTMRFRVRFEVAGAA
jgi:uncharacterized protein YggE